MALIDTSTHIEADPARVWQVLVDWEGQPAWMADARSVDVLSPAREGVGVVLRCMTDIAGGIVVTDDMIVTEWKPEREIAIRHLGWLIRGVGAFEIEPTQHGTLFRWWEEVTVPFGSLGETVAGAAVVPTVTRVFRRSLAGLKRVCEQGA